MKSSTNPDNFVRIAHGISLYGAFILPNFVKYIQFLDHIPRPAPIRVCSTAR